MQPFAYLLSLPGSRETERETLSLFFFEEEEGEGTGRVSFDRSKLARVDLFISGTYLPTQARDTPAIIHPHCRSPTVTHSLGQLFIPWFKSNS